ncbi:uncharacterized protein YrzB (UPF0473 family) [Paenibacillus sp. PvP094]|uniref:DUF1292 domain-containing protein n=1 Tax=Paenibacillus TaxID=44249 RepID=UPI000FD7FCF3|nr:MULTISPECIES: DUF1292 domain-containing protein [Paenibacillus]
MTEYSRKDLKWTDSLRLAFGAHVELEEENGKSQPYDLLAEFEVHGQQYAVLRSSLRPYDEVELLRVLPGSEDQIMPELVTIDDDEEWENISELYDECTLPIDED